MYMKGEHIWSLFQPFYQKPTDVRTMEAGFGLQKHIIAAALYCDAAFQLVQNEKTT